MSRYIDAEWIRNVYADFEHYDNRNDWTTPIANVLAVIDDAPSIAIEPKRGKWEEKEVFHNGDDPIIEEWQSARCSVCHKYHTTPYMYYFDNYNFCPNCGADMRKESD